MKIIYLILTHIYGLPRELHDGIVVKFLGGLEGGVLSRYIESLCCYDRWFHKSYVVFSRGSAAQNCLLGSGVYPSTVPYSIEPGEGSLCGTTAP